jgi:hypothetical protein
MQIDFGFSYKGKGFLVVSTSYCFFPLSKKQVIVS